MKGKVFLSYIVPCYNIQDYLPRCLDSLSKQRINSDAEVEFVLVNDGSPDDCLQILNKFSFNEKRAIVIDQVNQGVSAARNNGLKVARGEYVFFLDGDDYLTDDASQILYDVSKVEEHKGDILITNAYKVKDGNWDRKEDWDVCSKMHNGLYSVEEYVKNVDILPISFKAYRRELLVLNDIKFDEELKVGEVFTFFLHALHYCQSVLVTNERVMNYVVRDSGVMHYFDIEKDKTILSTIFKMDRYASKPSLDLKKYMSYNAAFYQTVRIFTLNKYARQSVYTPEIGRLLKAVAEANPFHKVLRFITFRKGPIKIRIYATGQLFLPIRFYYACFRFLIKHFSQQELKKL